MSAIEWLAFASIAASGTACIVALWAKTEMEKARREQAEALCALMQVIAAMDDKLDTGKAGDE